MSEDLTECEFTTPFDELHDIFQTWCENEGANFKKVEKCDVKKTLIKEQEKTKAGPVVFGKNQKENAPNGTTRLPKFNFRQVDDDEDTD